jgi:CO/xanthine dehydrogenase Mo-binding subunit
LLSRLKTKKLFETGLKYVLDNDPTYADLDVFVSGLLGKPKEKKHTLIRPSKNTVVNREDLAEDISEAVAEAVAEAEEQMKQAKAEAKQAKVEVKKLEAVLSKAKLKRDDEPTPDQIKEAQEFDYDDGENLVRIDLFKAKYKALLRKKELQKKIAEMLHDAGMRHVEAIIRDRQVPAMGRKAAA